MGRVSVAEAAQLLGVHSQRIHQRIQDGSLPAERIGAQWSIDESDLALVRHRKKPGRPLSARSAWALAAVASADKSAAARLSPSERSRARSRLRSLLPVASADNLDEAAAVLAVALGNRAGRRLLVAPARDLPDLRVDERLRLAGVSLPDSNIAAGQVAEGYVLAREVDDLIEDHLLSSADRRRANVILHVVDDESDRLALVDVAESLLIRAADLAEHDGIREKDEALRLVAQLQTELDARGAAVIGSHDG